MQALKFFPFAKFLAFIGGLIGLVCGVLYSFGGFLIDLLVSLEWINTNETPGLSYGMILTFGALVGMPLIFATAGFILGLLGGVLFNLYHNYAGRSLKNWENDIFQN